MADKVTAGVGAPVAASWAGVNSTSVLLPSFATHRSPEWSKASPSGWPRLPPVVAERVTAGVEEPVESWAALNSTTVLLSVFTAHRSPEWSKARPVGSSRVSAVAERVAAGVGAPVAASWPGVNSTTVLLGKSITNRSPAESKARPSGEFRLVPTAESVTAGVGAPVAASWAGVNSTTVLFPLFATHRSPEGPKAMLNALSRLSAVADRVTAGAEAPLMPSWPGVNSTKVLLALFSTHRSPPRSKARVFGPARLPALAERVTAGVGEPLAASWAGVNSTTVLFPPFVTHRSPEDPKASPDGLFTLSAVAERVTAGVGEPVTASWLGVNSTTVLLALFVTHRLPEGPKASPDGSSRLPAVAYTITAGVGEPLVASWPGVNSTTVLL